MFKKPVLNTYYFAKKNILHIIYHYKIALLYCYGKISKEHELFVEIRGVYNDGPSSGQISNYIIIVVFRRHFVYFTLNTV